MLDTTLSLRLLLPRLWAPLLLCAAALSLFSVDARAQDKVGFVDLQRALNEVDEGASAKKALKKEFDEKQKKLDEKQNELKAMKDELDARGNMMKPEALEAKRKELGQKLGETQQLYMQLQTELSKREQDATAEIFKKMGVILQTIGEEQGFAMIYEKSAIVYAKPSLDVTNELIRRYNDSYGKKKSATAPAPKK